MDYKLHNDDCVKVLKSYPENYFDSIVADPPAGISFMGKDWDHDKGGRNAWISWMTTVALECLRTLKPGGHAVIWALPRTSHWVATAWEDAGFEVRDRISHVFGSGFPKSYNVAKGIESVLTNGSASWNDFHKLNGKKGDKNSRGANGLVKSNQDQGNRPDTYESHGTLELEPTTDEAKQWDGWGTALKPAMEDWWLFRKPISEKNVALNVLKWGTGALNIDASRIEISENDPGHNNYHQNRMTVKEYQADNTLYELGMKTVSTAEHPKGRWPANLIHDGSDEVVSLFPPAGGQQAPTRGDGTKINNSIYNDGWNHKNFSELPRKDSGSAARFFYCAKPDKTERNEGLNGNEEIYPEEMTGRKTGSAGLIRIRGDGTIGESPYAGKTAKSKNHHPTVKAQSLMKFLITLVTPPNGIVLDCFMGSGSTGVAAIKLGFGFVGIDNDKEFGYFQIAEKRIKHAAKQMRLF